MNTKTETEATVVSIADYKQTQKLNDFKKDYTNYLKLLKTNELETEVLHILDENTPAGVDLSIIDKSTLILSEIADRTTPSLSKYINRMKSRLEF